jgi:endonuclease/exonuclease/phosphatase family metal-dependent hydrolase
LGLEGSAILTRYPIKAARIVRLPQEYDWYHGEIQALSDLEKARRWTAERIFEERIKRQVRRGGRLAMIVDLEIPGSPTGVVTVVCPHLEDYCGPRGRREQMRYLLSQIQALQNPVIMGGDLNTLGHNGRPLTVKRAVFRYLLDYHFWLREAFFFFVPVPGIGEGFRVANYWKNWRDPTAINVPILLSNPERHIFDDVRSFRFQDGDSFDFAGDRRLSYRHRGGTLADSSQRAWKGFTPTFSFRRTFGGLVGEYKIDWFFVKTALVAHPTAAGSTESLTAEFGRTLPLVNTALQPRISDHCPTTLEVPLVTSTPQ